MKCFALSVVLLLCGVFAAEGVYDLYDGSLQPFSYAELQATSTSTATPSFIPPDTLYRGPEAFPFNMPALPSDFQAHSQGSHVNPYNSEPQGGLQSQSWNANHAVVQRALDTQAALPSMVEATATVSSAPELPDASGPVPQEAARTTPLADPADNTDFSDEQAATEEPSAEPAAAPPMDGPRFASAKDSASATQVPSSSSRQTVSSPVVSSGLSRPSTSSSLPSSSSLSPTSVTSGSTSQLPSQSSMHETSDSDEDSGPTPISSPPKPLHRCIPTGNKKSCRIDFDSNSIPWRVVTVPHLDPNGGSSLGCGSQSTAPAIVCNNNGPVSGSSASGSGSSSDDDVQEEYSSSPEIARAQKAYYNRLRELIKEKRWMAEVSRIVEEYNFKIKNVNKHASSLERDLQKNRKDIVSMIKSEKQAKLQKELEAALESLQKLESTSQALTGKMQELTQTKLGLKQTIAKIQRVVTSSGGSAPSSLLELQDTLKPTADEARFAEKQEANDSAKKLFGSLLEMVSKASQTQTSKAKASSRARSRAISINLDQAEDEERQERIKPEADLFDISDRAAAIAAKYADEENNRMHTKLHLRALSSADYKKTSDDDLFLD